MAPGATSHRLKLGAQDTPKHTQSRVKRAANPAYSRHSLASQACKRNYRFMLTTCILVIDSETGCYDIR